MLDVEKLVEMGLTMKNRIKNLYCAYVTHATNIIETRSSISVVH